MTQAITHQKTTGTQAPRRTTVADLIVAKRDSFAQVLPKFLDGDRFVKVALAALTKTPDLAKCSQASLLSSLIACAEVGLEPNGALGHAYLIPFMNRGQLECQLIFGYRGLIALARRSDEIKSISCHVVYERDKFLLKYGLEEDLIHEPYMGKEDPGAIIAAYAICKTRNGGVQLEVMTRRQIDEIKNASKGLTNRDGSPNRKSPWNTSFDEMARKTVIRRAWKYWPVSTEVQERISRAVEIEDSDKPIAAQFEVKSTVDDLESALEAETQAPELAEAVNPVTGEVTEQWIEGPQ